MTDEPTEVPGSENDYDVPAAHDSADQPLKHIGEPVEDPAIFDPPYAETKDVPAAHDSYITGEDGASA